METRAPYYTGSNYTWSTIARRLESCARGMGVKVVIVRVVVRNGRPVHWTKPEVTPIEPASKADRFVALLTGEA